MFKTNKDRKDSEATLINPSGTHESKEALESDTSLTIDSRTKLNKNRADSEATVLSHLSREADVTQSLLKASNEATFIRVEGQDNYIPINRYEGRKHYDPTYTWSTESENRLVWKIDLRMFSWICVAFVALQLDRGNLQLALSDKLLENLQMSRSDYNLGQTIFFVCFLVGGIPNQLMAKRFGPERWFSCQLTMWSLITALQSLLRDKSSYLALRALLGFLEGGAVAELVLYLSFWYTSRELSKRLWIFFSAFPVASIIGAFLATGLLALRGVNHLPGWSWLFAIEGTIGSVIGIITFIYLPPGPFQTKATNSWIRLRSRRGWLTEQEEKIQANRILRDDPSKGDMHNRQPITFRLFWHAIRDWELWPLYLLALTSHISSIPTTQNLTLILKDAHFSRFDVNLLIIPAYVIFIINIAWLIYLGERTHQRLLIGFLTQLYSIGPLVALIFLSSHTSKWSRYAPLILLVGAPYVHAILVALTSRNAGSVRTRAMSIAVLDMCLQASNTIGSNIYQEKDAPLYRTGNKILVALVAYNAVLFVACRYFYGWRNYVRQKQWHSMNRVEKVAYLQWKTGMKTARAGQYEESVIDASGAGNRMLTFRFAY